MQLAVKRDDKLHAVLFCHTLKIVTQPLTQRCQIDALSVQRLAGVCGFGEKQHVINHLRQPLQLRIIGTQQRLILADAARLVKRHFRLAKQRANRRAQIVCHVR